MKLLASVTGPDEAEIVLAGGADFIDLKDPADGPLGAVSPQILDATIARIAGRRPVSAVAGNLPMVPATVCAAVGARRAADYVKIGLFPARRDDRLGVIEALAEEAEETKLIAVFFADADPDFSLLPALSKAGFSGAMVDTMGKSGRGLLSHLSIADLDGFVSSARALGLMTGLAGSLEPPDVTRLAVLSPDYLGFRGALTCGDRKGPIDPEAVRAISALLVSEAGGRVGGPAMPGDRIFVSNYTLPMEIGAYGFERGKTQTVRFSVEAEIDPIASGARSIAEVYSYDLVLDAIRRLAARGHTDLVETLALELAAAVLSDGRVREVSVRVEKLELGPDAVGVALTRRR